MNLLILSDDHGLPGFYDAYKMAVKMYGKIDAVIHAGDSERRTDGEYLKTCNCPVYIVRGNNDYHDFPEFIETEIAEKNFFITHGHRYGVHAGVTNLYYAGKERKADVIVYGHTHRAFCESYNDTIIVNPGSLTLPRGGKNGSFAVMIIDNMGKIKLNHFTLENKYNY